VKRERIGNETRGKEKKGKEGGDRLEGYYQNFVNKKVTAEQFLAFTIGLWYVKRERRWKGIGMKRKRKGGRWTGGILP
jgi:hypothetical protein